VSRGASPSALDSHVCPACLARLEALPASEVLAAIATPPSLPSDLQQSHQLCASCLSVHRIDAAHDRLCVFRMAGIVLSVAGWTSGIAEALRADLRSSASHATVLLTRIFRILVRPYLAEDSSGIAIVPVPTANSKGGSRDLGFVARQVADEMALPVVDVFQRTKRTSTRASVAQKREAIVREEYSIISAHSPEVAGRRIVLLDDVVTTGHTMSGLAHKLTALGAREILPIALDRTVSARLLQRLPSVAPDRCPHR
jgi:predicted amidophosphoribosyltransferase